MFRYSLLDHNCNTFSNEVANFLTGTSIPSYILELPEKVKSSPVAALLTPIIEGATPRGQDIQDANRHATAQQQLREHQQQHQQQPGADEPNPYNHFPLCKYVTFAKEIDAARFR